jgi:hypothetical protein
MAYFLTVMMLMALAASCDRNEKQETEEADSLAVEALYLNLDAYTMETAVLQWNQYELQALEKQSYYQNQATIHLLKDAGPLRVNFLRSFLFTDQDIPLNGLFVHNVLCIGNSRYDRKFYKPQSENSYYAS